ncbi:unnamed protein product [Periconia digitata]|uniref:Uncharacterized protein n=1 Tax=Periconia digitata TaxID=1303443 RepID=A0A9W4UBG7_9PLEO|nr:unnamed protein product [Periconia digitata]
MNCLHRLAKPPKCRAGHQGTDSFCCNPFFFFGQSLSAMSCNGRVNTECAQAGYHYRIYFRPTPLELCSDRLVRHS